MVSITTVLERLKDECKKDITKTSSSSSSSNATKDYDYNIVSIKLFGENYLIKKVSMASVSSYKVGWVLNNQINSCMKCDIPFGMFHWRHHCRACGYLVCKRCGVKRLAIPELKAIESLSRVCKGCFHSYSHSNGTKQQYCNSMMTTSTTTSVVGTNKEDMTSNGEDYLSYDMIHSTHSSHTKEETPVKDNNNNNNNAYINNDNNDNSTIGNLSPASSLTSFDHTTRLYMPKIRLSIQDSGNPLLRSPKALT